MLLPQSGTNNTIGYLLNYILINYYAANSYTTCVLQKINENNLINFSEYSHDVPFMWVTVYRSETNFEVFTEILQRHIDAGCQSFFISDSLIELFFDVYWRIKDQCQNRWTKIYLTVISVNKKVDRNFEKRLMAHPLITEIPFIILIQPETNLSIQIFTIEIFSKANIAKLTYLDTFFTTNRTIKYGFDLFSSKKLRNLNQRPIRLSIFNYQPYTIWEKVTPGQGNANIINTTDEKSIWIDGTESLVFLEFCLKYNCTLTVLTEDNGQWGEIYRNHSGGNGIIGAAFERKVDVSVGAIYVWYSVYLHLALSMPISRTGITCFVLKPKILSGWFMPVFPFSLNLWFAVMLSLIAGIVGLKIVQDIKIRLKSINDGMTVEEMVWFVYKIYVLQSISLISTHASFLFITGALLLIGMLIGNAYGGGLASVMTVPQYEPAIHTVQQLAESNLDWAATHDAWIFSILAANQPKIVKLVNKFHTYPKDVLKNRMDRANLAFSIERLPYGHFAVGDYITEDGLKNYQIMLEDIYWEYCLAISSKTWPLLPILDELILQIAESGIQKYWELKVVMNHSNNKIQLMAASRSAHHENMDPISLKVAHLLGVFGLLCVGLFISTVVFVLELMYYHNHLKRDLYSLKTGIYTVFNRFHNR